MYLFFIVHLSCNWYKTRKILISNKEHVCSMRKKYYTFLPWTLRLVPSFDSELDKLLRVLHPI